MFETTTRTECPVTAPEPTWTVTDHAGMPTLLRDSQPVAYLDDGMLRVSPMFAEQGFAVLTRVLAAQRTAATAMAVAERDGHAWDLMHPDMRSYHLIGTKRVLAALAGTSAQARHTADGGAGGAS